MRCLIILTWVALCGAAVPTWPSSTDELEDFMFLNSGFRQSGFASAVTPCGFSAAGPGRNTAAEWIRTVFHDMINGDIYGGTGGLDASIMFETDRPENIGAAFNSSLAFFANFYSSRTSVSDLIALSMYTAVRSCGGPIVSIRAGRIDATVAGPEGFVPVPQSSTTTFEDEFARTGFTPSDMITMTACGHTIGGVHAEDFPQIVPVGSAPNNFVAIDSTPTVFDNRVAVEWITGNTTDPMTVGPSVAAGQNSDFKVFGADGNATMQALTNPATFASSCQSILQRMIEVVPPQVVFTSALVPYDVKPTALQLTLLSGGASISFTGLIRVRTTVLPASNIASVQLTYLDRTGGNACGACIIQTTSIGSTTGFDDSFEFYSFSATIPSDTSISSFDVLVDLVGGGSELYDNNGARFPVQDSIMFQSPQSCLSQGSLTVVAAVRNDRTSLPVSLDLSLMEPRQGVIVPALDNTSVPMTQGATVGPYSLYSASYTLVSGQAATTKFDVTSGSSSSTSEIADEFKSTADLGSTCASLSGGSSSSSSSSTSSTTSSASSTSSTSSTTTSASSATSASSTASASSTSSLSITTSSISNSTFVQPTSFTTSTSGILSSTPSTNSSTTSKTTSKSYSWSNSTYSSTSPIASNSASSSSTLATNSIVISTTTPTAIYLSTPTYSLSEPPSTSNSLSGLTSKTLKTLTIKTTTTLTSCPPSTPTTNSLATSTLTVLPSTPYSNSLLSPPYANSSTITSYTYSASTNSTITSKLSSASPSSSYGNHSTILNSTNTS